MIDSYLYKVVSLCVCVCVSTRVCAVGLLSLALSPSLAHSVDQSRRTVDDVPAGSDETADGSSGTGWIGADAALLLLMLRVFLPPAPAGTPPLPSAPPPPLLPPVLLLLPPLPALPSPWRRPLGAGAGGIVCCMCIICGIVCCMCIICGIPICICICIPSGKPGWTIPLWCCACCAACCCARATWAAWACAW